MYIPFLTTDASQHAVELVMSLYVFTTPRKLGRANELYSAQGYDTPIFQAMYQGSICK